MADTTDKSINRQIAEKLGYHVYHYDKDVAESCYYQLWDAEGTPVALLRDGQRKTEAEAWADCPDWQGDLRLAMDLLGRRPFTIERKGAVDLTVTVRFYPGSECVSTDGPTIAEAICLAFLVLDLEAERREARLMQLHRQQLALDEEIRRLEAGGSVEESA